MRLRTSLVVQLLRIRLPMQGTWIQSLGPGRFHLLRVSCTLVPQLLNTTAREATSMRSLHTTARVAPAGRNSRKRGSINKDPAQPKNNNNKISESFKNAVVNTISELMELRSLEWLWRKILNCKDLLLPAFNLSQLVINVNLS